MGSATIGGQTVSGTFAIILDIVIIVIWCLMAYSFLYGIKRGWWLALLYFGFAAIASLYTLFVFPILFPLSMTIYYGSATLVAGLALNLIYIAYLTRPHVRKWFSR